MKVAKFEVTNFDIRGLFFGVLGPGVTAAACYSRAANLCSDLNYQRYRFRSPPGLYLIYKHVLIVASIYYIEHIRPVLLGYIRVTDLSLVIKEHQRRGYEMP